MEPFKKLTSSIALLPYNDVDTDQIIPASYLKVTTKDGLAEGCFARWRYTSEGDLRSDFPLNNPIYDGARILLAGDNFGTGSSREHAAWALLSRGYSAVISTSFADIFRNNALKNGLLPISVDQEIHQELISIVEEDPTTRVTVDLTQQELRLPDGRRVHFPIDPFNKTCLLEGIDQLGYLLKQDKYISDFERERESAE